MNKKFFNFSLGPTNSQSNDVDVKPFSTSVHKILTCVFATITKICTNNSSSQAYAYNLQCYYYASLHIYYYYYIIIYGIV